MVPQISLNLLDNGYIRAIDVATYDTGQADYVAIILFWSKDAFVADFNIDQTGFAASTWLISSEAQQTYNFYAAYFYKWDVSLDVSLARYAIVYKDGLYFIKITSGTVNMQTSGAPDLDNVNWAVFILGSTFVIDGVTYSAITAHDMYLLSIASITTHSQPIHSTTALIFTDIGQFTLAHLDCLSWKITINISCTIISATLNGYNGTVLKTLDILGNEVDVVLGDDGAYTVNISYYLPDQDATAFTIAQIPIFDVCQVQECYTKLFKYFICSCNDPCAEDSDCGKNSTIKTDMNMIRELILELTQMVNFAHYQLMGVYSLSQQQDDFISQIGQMIDELHIVTDRCGLCDSTMQLDMPC